MVKRKNNIQGDENDKIQTGETMNIENGMKNDNDDCIKVFPDDSRNSEALNCKIIGHNVSGNLNEITPVYNKTNIGNTLSGSCEMSPNKIKAEDVKLTKFVKSDRISGEVSHPKSFDLVVEELEDCIGEVVDIHRTGAKCLQGEDSRLPGASYHQVGAVRTKPGRGDPTLSVSCSDKMTRWILCGLQVRQYDTKQSYSVIPHVSTTLHYFININEGFVYNKNSSKFIFFKLNFCYEYLKES